MNRLVPRTRCWRVGYHRFINGPGMDYTVTRPVLQVSEGLRCPADTDTGQDTGNSRGPWKSRTPTKEPPCEEREDNASKKKIYPIYKTGTELSLSRG